MPTPADTTIDPLATSVRASALDEALERLSAGWSEGRNPPVEEFFSRIDPGDPEARVELVYHEFCLAEAAGLAPDPAAYRARFPALEDRLARLFGLHEALDEEALRSWSPPGEVAMPEAGDEIGPYRLLRELGRGGLARVFLAEQADLEDRLVALKVAARPSAEAALQARVRHPHIVEVLARAVTGDGRFHLIAMPYLGGATLSALMARGGWRSGRDLVAALDDAAPGLPSAEPARGADRALLIGLDRAEASAWIVARLAEALAHAARRGVTHGDIKPANILMAADAKPMLLDFNLAADWRGPGVVRSVPLGGTLAYMAPERLRALVDPKSAPTPRPGDRQRADLYALGLVLRELLTGQKPVAPDPGFTSPRDAADSMLAARVPFEASARQHARGVPAGLRPILARCLATDPADRYPGMAELAEDLDAWREGRAAEHSRRGTAAAVGRWLALRRGTVALAAGLLLLAGAGGVAAWSIMNARLRSQAEAKLAALWDAGDPGTFRARRFGSWQVDDEASVAAAKRDLDRYGVLGPSDWRQRDDVRSLGPADRDDLEVWLLERAWRYASALSARADQPDDWRRALALLDRDARWASLDAFADAGGALREKLGLPRVARPAKSAEGWLQAYASGLSAEGNSPGEARGAYARVLRERPQGFWPRYRAAATAARLNDFGGAADHLALCLARRPGNAALLVLRSICLLGAGETSAALAACEQALAIDPGARDAYLARSLIRIQLGQTSAAQADLDRFIALSRDRPAEAWVARETVAARSEGKTRRADPTPAVAEAARPQALLAARLEREGRVEDALAAYDRAVQLDPEDLRARVGRAHLLMRERRNEARSEMADLVEHPRFEELVRQDPPTLRVFLYLVEFRLRGGDSAEALALSGRALRLATSLDASRPLVPYLIAEAQYARARALARGAADDPRRAQDAADLLRAAGKVDGKFLTDYFPRDDLFNAGRGPIEALLR